MIQNVDQGVWNIYVIIISKYITNEKFCLGVSSSKSIWEARFITTSDNMDPATGVRLPMFFW